jgi:hypothetical protein
MTEIVKIVNGQRIPLTAEEIAEHNANLPSAEVVAERKLNALRAERNQRLAVTDWWVLPDRTATDEQLAYRQALRDITDTYSSLDDVVWPEKPE